MNKGKGRAREGEVIYKLNEIIRIGVEPPQVLLDVTTGLMRFYPLFLKASLLLQRFVQ